MPCFRRGAPQLDPLIADLDRFLGSVGEVDDLRGNLLGEPREVHGIGAGGLEAAVVLFADRLGDGIGIGAEQAEFGVFLRVVVEAASEAADGSGIRQFAESVAHGRAGSKVQETIWSKSPTPALPINPCNNLLTQIPRLNSSKALQITPNDIELLERAEATGKL